MQRVKFCASVFASLLLLVSCAQPVREPIGTPSTTPTPPPVDTSGADVYRLSSEQSQIHILVYRGGRFARLGHNHVVSSGELTGRAWLHSQFERSGFELSLPVQTLIVDDPGARARYGDEFPPVSASDVEGTRKNMLKPEVLDAEHYPNVTLRSIRVAGSITAPTVTALVTIKDVGREMQIPMKIEADGKRVIASGEFDLLQTDFGMKPFSVALGALEVQDRLHLVYRLVGEREG